MASALVKRLLIGLVSASTFFYPLKQATAQSPPDYLGFFETLKKEHMDRDWKNGIPFSEIEEHINNYHHGINIKTTKRVRRWGNFARFYRSNDGNVFMNIGTSKDEFIVESENPRYIWLKTRESIHYFLSEN